jgi:GntR family transcriptional regulator, transcriptional repressor for pyruvate dehydrogenase complex
VRLPHSSLPETAAGALLEIILRDGLAEGDPLPSSAELADRFKVSGVVIREALAILSARGVLSRRQGREPVVAKPGPEVLVDVWRVRAHHDAMDVEEFMQCRAALELQAAAQAAKRRDPGQLAEHIEAMRAAETSEAFNAADVAFHMELARLAGNRAIEVVLASLQAVVYEVFTYGLEQVSNGEGMAAGGRVADLHAAIMTAVTRGNPRRAAKAMADHFSYSLPDMDLSW